MPRKVRKHVLLYEDDVEFLEAYSRSHGNIGLSEVLRKIIRVVIDQSKKARQ